MPLLVPVGGKREIRIPSADQQVEVQLLRAMVISFPISSHFKVMRIYVNGERTYAQCSPCPDTELSPNHIFDCPTILRVWQGVYFSPAEELYSYKIV
ncbi:hypothetical protein AVEN_194529-1 [Araneus ventricosus]|uniref:Uncharacterized protein n=1 Tax=Araneus ventricosus TaxID=182803 RepID=A0A4Y2A686_ARAVE|nr:hypothetical protein AVEN_194529-1 [Araneus ventricosus]